MAVALASGPMAGGAQAMPGGRAAAHPANYPLLVPFQASGWKYLQTAHGAVAGFESPAFNDSAWPSGQAGFGSTNGPCSWNNATQVHTPWSLGTDMLVRRHLTIPANYYINIQGTVDDTAKVYVNGALVQSATGGSCLNDTINVSLAPSQLTADTVLAIRGTDNGIADFLDVQVYAYSKGGNVLVPFQSQGWKYLQTAYGGAAGFESQTFNDSAWPIGQAAFGSASGPCTWNTPTQVHTPWSIGTDMLVRRHLAIPPGWGINIQGTVDDSAKVYVNGALVQSATGGSCLGNTINVNVPAWALTADTVLAIRGTDIGIASFLDVKVTAQ